MSEIYKPLYTNNLQIKHSKQRIQYEVHDNFLERWSILFSVSLFVLDYSNPSKIIQIPFWSSIDMNIDDMGV